MNKNLQTTVGLAAAMAIIYFAATSVRASVIIDEDFDGTAGSPPSATDWDYTGAVTLDGAGNAVFDSTGGFQQLVGKFSGPSSQAYAPVGTNIGQVTFSNITGNVLYNGFLGLSGAGMRIWLRTDIGNGLWTVDINTGGTFTYRPTDVAKTAGGTWMIQWHTNKVLVYHNGALKFNSLTDIPTVGDPAWSIPLGAARPDIGGAGGQIMNIDRITWSSEFEPVSNPLVGVIIDDDFNGTAGGSLSAAYWDYTGAVTLDGVGNVVLNSTAGNVELLGKASQAYAPSGTNNFGQVTFSNITGNVLWNMALGLSGLSGERVWVRTDIGNGLWTVDINSGGAFTHRATDVPKAVGGTWMIQWFTNQILVYHDGVLKLDSLTDLPTVGDSAWSIPLGAARPIIGGAGGQIMSLDSVTWSWESLTNPPEDVFAAWQFHYFSGGSNNVNAAAEADPDGDGMSNTNEFLAGFNPTNSAASLKIISVAKSGTDVVVTYLGANGDGSRTPPLLSCTNVLEIAADIGSGGFTSVATNILTGGTGLGTVTNMVDSGGATNAKRFYRIRVAAQ